MYGPAVAALIVASVLAPQSDRAPAAQDPAPRIGVISGPMGSFAGTVLKSLQIEFRRVADKLPSDSLAGYDLLVVDNLFRLQDLNGPAFRDFVERGGVLVILNPKADGFSRSWAPYDVFIGEPTIEGKIADKKHPLFQGFTSDKLQDFANSNGPFVGNCSFSEPAREWKVLAKHKNGKNAVILEAGFGQGWIVLACTRFDHYNAKAATTRLADNLFRYAIAKTRAGRGR